MSNPYQRHHQEMMESLLDLAQKELTRLAEEEEREQALERERERAESFHWALLTLRQHDPPEHNVMRAARIVGEYGGVEHVELLLRYDSGGFFVNHQTRVVRAAIEEIQERARDAGAVSGGVSPAVESSDGGLTVAADTGQLSTTDDDK